MNNTDRNELQRAIDLIEQAKEIVEMVKNGEQEKFENLSDGLQQSERGQKLEESASILDDVFSSLDEAIDGINSAF